MNNISERGVNASIFPVINSRGKSEKLKGDYELKHNDEIIFRSKEGCTWNYNSYKLMDYIASNIRLRLVKKYLKHFKKIPKKPNVEDFPLLESTDQLKYFEPSFKPKDSDERNDQNIIKSKYNLFLEFDLGALIKLPYFKGMTIKHLEDIFKSVSEFKVQCRYSFLTLNEDKIKYNTYSNIDKYYTTFFDYNISKRKNKKIAEIEFNSILGTLFLHNICTGGYNIIKNPDLFYIKLDKYSNILYRNNFLNFSPKPIWFKKEKLAERLCLKSKNKTVIDKKIRKCIEFLEYYKYIKVLKRIENSLQIIKNNPSKNSNIIKFPKK